MNLELIAPIAAGTVAFVTVMRWVGPPIQEGIRDWGRARKARTEAITQVLTCFPKIVEVVKGLSAEVAAQKEAIVVFREDWGKGKDEVVARLARIEQNGSKKGPPDAAL